MLPFVTPNITPLLHLGQPPRRSCDPYYSYYELDVLTRLLETFNQGRVFLGGAYLAAFLAHMHRSPH
jgi:hypothetical protein